MKELIEALQIFYKYIPEERWPTNCEHDVLFVACDPDKVSDGDKHKLEVLGFHNGNAEDSGYEHEGGFYSFRFGSR